MKKLIRFAFEIMLFVLAFAYCVRPYKPVHAQGNGGYMQMMPSGVFVYPTPDNINDGTQYIPPCLKYAPIPPGPKPARANATTIKQNTTAKPPLPLPEPGWTKLPTPNQTVFP